MDISNTTKERWPPLLGVEGVCAGVGSGSPHSHVAAGCCLLRRPLLSLHTTTQTSVRKEDGPQTTDDNEEVQILAVNRKYNAIP